MENLSNHYVSYQEFKQVLDSEMTRVAAGFVRIGFLLNYAQETNIINEGGYENINDFAKAEYNIDTTQVSRFVNIYKRFGVPGEPRLQDQYINHGVAKLGIMLTLPNFLNQEITEGYSKSEINTLKHEYEAEQQVSDIEVTIEHSEMKDSIQYSLPQILSKAVYQLIHDEPLLYARIYECIEIDDVKKILAPMGENSYIVRIKGIGRLTIFLKNTEISIINLREGSKENYSWQQLFDAFKEHFARGWDAKDSWSNVFQEPWPEEKKEKTTKASDKSIEKAEKTDKNNVAKPKKASKVNVVAPKPKPAPKAEESAKEPEEQLPGQDSIFNHPEYLPDDMDEKEVLTGEVEDIQPEGKIEVSTLTDSEVANPDNDNEQQASESMKVEYLAPVQDVGTEHAISGLKNTIKASLHAMHDLVEKDDWSMVISKATNIVHRAKKIQELEGKN